MSSTTQAATIPPSLTSPSRGEGQSELAGSCSRPGLRAVELQRGEPGVEPALAQQLRMRAGGRDASLVDDHDAVGLEHRRQAMGDDQRRAAGGERFERLLDEEL